MNDCIVLDIPERMKLAVTSNIHTVLITKQIELVINSLLFSLSNLNERQERNNFTGRR